VDERDLRSGSDHLVVDCDAFDLDVHQHRLIFAHLETDLPPDYQFGRGADRRRATTEP
jgi:hypothetical protein